MEHRGEMVEWTKAPHWKCGVGQLTEGSNPSLSAIFFAKKWRRSPQVFSSRCCANKSSSLKTEGFLPCHGVMQ